MICSLRWRSRPARGRRGCRSLSGALSRRIDLHFRDLLFSAEPVNVRLQLRSAIIEPVRRSRQRSEFLAEVLPLLAGAEKMATADFSEGEESQKRSEALTANPPSMRPASLPDALCISRPPLRVVAPSAPDSRNTTRILRGAPLASGPSRSSRPANTLSLNSITSPPMPHLFPLISRRAPVLLCVSAPPWFAPLPAQERTPRPRDATSERTRP
jgi:hypothetical protein